MALNHLGLRFTATRLTNDITGLSITQRSTELHSEIRESNDGSTL